MVISKKNIVLKKKQNYSYDSYYEVYVIESKREMFLLFAASSYVYGCVLSIEKNNYVWDKQMNENVLFYKDGKIRWQLYNGKSIK